jgi:hypothetical protein
MSGSVLQTLLSGMLAGAMLTGCTGAPPDTLTEEQLKAQVAQEKLDLAAEDKAEAEFQKSQRKQRR